VGGKRGGLGASGAAGTGGDVQLAGADGLPSALDVGDERRRRSTLIAACVAVVGFSFQQTGPIPGDALVRGRRGRTVLVSIGAVLALVPDSPRRTERSLDLPGMAILGAALAAGLIAIAEGPVWGWTAAPTLALFALAVAVFAIGVRHELRAGEPLVDLSAFASRPVVLANAATFASGFAVFGLYILIPTSSRRRGSRSTAPPRPVSPRRSSSLGWDGAPSSGRPKPSSPAARVPDGHCDRPEQRPA
jgi:hypothetical protein